MDTTEKIKVLYIDDESNNLFGFKAAFRTEYNILLANSATEGKALLQQHPDTHVIFCDQRMPDITGTQFFEDIASEYPDPVRILITGFTDVAAVVDSINKGQVFRYLTKPYQQEEIHAAIEQAYKYYMTGFMLRKKNEELQKANEDLDKFAYSVTHDIRGPILSILGALEIMKQTQSMEELHSICNMMEESALQVNDLIVNIHAYYSLQRGTIEIEEIDFKNLCQELAELHNIQLALANIKLTITVQQVETYHNSRVLLHLIINNLLSNAIKYQKDAEVNKFVNLSVQVNNGIATIKVADNGIGIETKYLDKIFNMFFRASESSTGSGFGLYNVKDALLKLKGDILVCSEIGKGSEFVITLPGK